MFKSKKPVASEAELLKEMASLMDQKYPDAKGLLLAGGEPLDEAMVRWCLFRRISPVFRCHLHCISIASILQDKRQSDGELNQPPSVQLTRFLHAEKNKPEAAAQRLSTYAQWRGNDCHLGSMRRDEVTGELAMNKVFYTDARDRQGHPLLIIKVCGLCWWVVLLHCVDAAMHYQEFISYSSYNTGCSPQCQHA